MKRRAAQGESGAAEDVDMLAVDGASRSTSSSALAQGEAVAGGRAPENHGRGGEERERVRVPRGDVAEKLEPAEAQQQDPVEPFPVFNVPTSTTGLLRTQSATLRMHSEMLEDIKAKLEEHLKFDREAKGKLEFKKGGVGPWSIQSE
ncbi:hypothetical protein FOZ60_002326 [Perkinsus olseni]|uniref:Uncharacterized protein n=1 Tax=Perkinsus olseni TaxID=32597 RepID=A0A7J6PJI6_PEROL|nr:hypothetical protein FOZ60_002326 [Perkinsus olseni]